MTLLITTISVTPITRITPCSRSATSWTLARASAQLQVRQIHRRTQLSQPRRKRGRLIARTADGESLAGYISATVAA